MKCSTTTPNVESRCCCPPLGPFHSIPEMSLDYIYKDRTVLARTDEVTRTSIRLDHKAHQSRSRSGLRLRDSFSCCVVSRVWALLKSKTEGGLSENLIFTPEPGPLCFVFGDVAKKDQSSRA